MRYFPLICVFFGCCSSGSVKGQVTDSTFFYAVQQQMNIFFTQKGKIGTGYKQWKRAEYYMRNRLGPGGKIVNATLKNENAKASILSAARPDNIENVSADWSFVGPDSIAGTTDHGKGRVNRFAFDPFNPAIVYAATSGGGLWKTINYGISWSPLTDGLGNLSIGGVAVDPSNSNTIYILTGDGDAMTAWNNVLIGTGRFCSGIYKSVDAGTTWQKLSGFSISENQKIFSYWLAVNPKDPNRIYACTSNGLYISFDGGNTWPESRHSFIGNSVFNIQVAPGTKDTVYAAVPNGIYRSSDGGDAFQGVHYITANNTAVKLAVTPSNPGYVFAVDYSGANSDKFGKLYRSVNYGQSYSVINSADSTTDFQIWSHMSIAVNPLSASFFAFSGKNIYYTSNQGATYRKSPNSIDNSYHVDVHDLAYAADGKLYAATDGGVYMSTDNGATFSYRSGGLCASQYYGLDIFHSNPDIIIAGAQDNSTHLKNSAGGLFNWKIGNDGLDGAINQSNSNIIYGSSQNGVFVKSVNGGATFADFKSPTTTDTADWRVPIRLDPNNQDIVFVGYKPISKFNGSTWSTLQPGVSGRTDLEIAKDNSNVIYAMDNNYNYTYDLSAPVSVLFRSINGGASFSNITPPLVTAGLLQITDVTLNPVNNAEAWISIGGFNSQHKIFRTIDGGSVWQDLTLNLPNVPVNCLLFQPGTAGVSGTVYAGTDIGVFFKTDNLPGWVYYSNHLPGAEVMDLALADNGYLYAATYGRGIWRVLQNNSICQTSYTLNAANTNSQSSYRYSAANFITSSAVHTGQDRTVIYKANDFVSLIPGFDADGTSNTFFTAIIGDCNNSDPANVPAGRIAAPVKANRITIKGKNGSLVKASEKLILKRKPAKVNTVPVKEPEDDD